MILRITDKPDDSNLKEYRIRVEEFNDITYHPYIATVKWEQVLIDLDGSINRSYLKQLINHVAVITPVVIADKEITAKEVLLLTTIYPDEMASLMKAMNAGKEAIDAEIKRLSERYSWTV